MNKLIICSITLLTTTTYGAGVPPIEGSPQRIVVQQVRSLQELAIEAVTRRYTPTYEAWSHHTDAERPDVIAASMVAQMPPSHQHANVRALLAGYYHFIARTYFISTPSYGFTPHYALEIYIKSNPYPELSVTEIRAYLGQLKKEYIDNLNKKNTQNTCSHDTQTAS